MSSDKDTKNVITALFNNMVSAFSLQTSLLVPGNGARLRKRLLQKANAAISTTRNRSTKQEPAFRNCLARASCRCSVVCIFTSPTANPVTCVPASQQTCRSHLKASAHAHTHTHTCDTTTAEEPTGKKWHEWAASLRETGSKEKNKRGLGLANDSNVQRAGVVPPCAFSWLARLAAAAQAHATTIILDSLHYSSCCLTSSPLLLPQPPTLATMSSSVSTATVSLPQRTVAGAKAAVPQQKAQEPQQASKGKQDEFFWTYTEEPHATRRQAIIKAHPEVHIT